MIKKNLKENNIKESNPIIKKIEVLMNEAKTKYFTSLNIHLDSATNYSSDNRFELNIKSYNNVDNLSEINNIFLSETLLNDLLTVLYYHKEKTIEYTKELQKLSKDFDMGLLSKNQYLELTRELKIKYKMLS